MRGGAKLPSSKINIDSFYYESSTSPISKYKKQQPKIVAKMLNHTLLKFFFKFVIMTQTINSAHIISLEE